MSQTESIKKEFLIEILKQMMEKYRHLIEIERMTTELSDALNRDDMISTELLLNMRGEEMEQISRCMQNLELLLSTAGETEQEAIRALVKGKQQTTIQGFEADKIVELAGTISRLLDKIVMADKVMNKRLAGENSYYHS